MNLNIFEIFVFVSVVQGILFAIIILTQKRFRVQANQLLAFNTFILSFIGIIELLKVEDYHIQFPIIDYIGEGIPWLLLLYTPAFLYFLQTTKHPWSKSKYLYFLFVPFFFFWIIHFLFFLQFEKDAINWGWLIKRDLLVDFELYTSIVLTVILNIASFVVIAKSKENRKKKKWLFQIVVFHAFLILTWIIDFIMPSELYPFEAQDIIYTVWLPVALYLYWLIFHGLVQLKLAEDQTSIQKQLKEQHSTSNILEEELVSKPKEDTVLKTDEEQKDTTENLHFLQFQLLLENEKIYKNPDLSRDDVAEMLGISSGYLSQQISQQTDSNFTTIVNSYRVNEVKQLLLNPAFEQFSIVAIGLEAGFKSKSTFYSEFKKHTTMTPKQFQSAQKES